MRVPQSAQIIKFYFGQFWVGQALPGPPLDPPLVHGYRQSLHEKISKNKSNWCRDGSMNWIYCCLCRDGCWIMRPCYGCISLCGIPCLCASFVSQCIYWVIPTSVRFLFRNLLWRLVSVLFDTYVYVIIVHNFLRPRTQDSSRYCVGGNYGSIWLRDRWKMLNVDCNFALN